MFRSACTRPDTPGCRADMEAPLTPALVRLVLQLLRPRSVLPEDSLPMCHPAVGGSETPSVTNAETQRVAPSAPTACRELCELSLGRTRSVRLGSRSSTRAVHRSHGLGRDGISKWDPGTEGYPSPGSPQPGIPPRQREGGMGSKESVDTDGHLCSPVNAGPCRG